MQGKGIIKFFLLLMLIVTALQFFFMYPTNKVEKAADAFAESKSIGIANEGEALIAKTTARNAYLDSMSTEKILTIPGLADYTYNDLKSKQLALGLDLKGGMSAVLEVKTRELLENLSSNSSDETFKAALDAADIAKQNASSSYVDLFGQAYNRLKSENSKSLATIFMRNSSLREDINLDSDDGEVIRVLGVKAKESVQLTFQMLKERINKMGVAQPTASLDANRDLILIELPGVENKERAREMLAATANLEFWNTYRLSDPGVPDIFQAINNQLKVEEGVASEQSPEIEYDTIPREIMDENGNFLRDTFDIVEKTPDFFNNDGPLFSKLTLNGGVAGNYSNNVIGVAKKNERKAISDMLAKPSVANLIPSDMLLFWSAEPGSSYDENGNSITSDLYELYMIKKDPGKNQAPLDGGMVTTAGQGPNPDGQIAVNLGMSSEGAKRWAALTRKASQNGNREVAIVLDNEVVSCPRVNGPIEGGRTEITGSFSVQEASDLANILEIGKLPAGIEIIQEKTVGPSLGKKNIKSSQIALIMGFALLLLFMIVYYGGAGLVAIISLLLNLLFIFGALASFGTVLTLPGIAGVILTIGMAVDVNVIVFERVKEELRIGKTLLTAIADGFKNSYSAIIDANVTTILVAFVLAYFGLGPIKGFAVVLIIGVVCSLFTALLIGKMIMDWWTRGDRNISFWTPPTKNAFANLNIDWIGKRKIAYVISSVIIIAGLISIFTKSFDLGVDFKGGYAYDVQFQEDIDIGAETIRSGLATYFGSTPVVKAVDTENTFNIVTDYKIKETGEKVADEVIAKLNEGVNAITGQSVKIEDFSNSGSATTKVISSSKVGPTIADDIKKSSFYAGIFALLMVFLYIFIRFNKWQYSMGAVTALFHDSLVTLGLFSLLWGIVPFSLEIDQAFIAALLTIIGYSINDTVVVFDRIREYLGIYTNKTTDEVLNLAINSTFSRTIVTSLTTLIMVLTLLIFGGSTIKGFAFALLIGILVGTYSSIFVATPIVRDFSDDLKPKGTSKSSGKSSFSRRAAEAK